MSNPLNAYVQLSLLHERDHLAHPADRRFLSLEVPIRVEEHVRSVLEQLVHADAVTCHCVRLANLDEASKRRQKTQRLLHGASRQTVQDQVATLSLRGVAHVRGKGARAGVEHEIGTETTDVLLLLLVAHRRDHRASRVVRQLNGRRSHAAGSSVNQHDLPRRCLSHVDHRCVGGGVGNEQAGGLLQRDVRGLSIHVAALSDRVRGKSVVQQTEHLVANTHMLHVLSDRLDHAARLQTNVQTGPTARERISLEKADRDHHVLVVETRVVHAHADVVVSHSPLPHLASLVAVETAFLALLQRPVVGLRLAVGLLLPLERLDLGLQPLAAAEHQLLVLVSVSFENLRQCLLLFLR